MALYDIIELKITMPGVDHFVRFLDLRRNAYHVLMPGKRRPARFMWFDEDQAAWCAAEFHTLHDEVAYLAARVVFGVPTSR